jgi:hypothetical protein
MSYLLDTNFIVGILRGLESYWNYLDTLLELNQPCISAITRAEIYAGCHPTEKSDTANLLECFITLPIEGAIADLAGQHIYGFARKGITLHLEDALIGATAGQEGLILVTQNVNHFPMLTLHKNLIAFPHAN